jgi:hypothetical protein
MKTEHTPAPWTLVAGRAFHTSGGNFYLAYGVDHVTGSPMFKDFCELDANARLISAAPDMLYALRKAKNWIDGDASMDMDDHDHAIYNETMEAINAAIDLATKGKQ